MAARDGWNNPLINFQIRIAGTVHRRSMNGFVHHTATPSTIIMVCVSFVTYQLHFVCIFIMS